MNTDGKMMNTDTAVKLEGVWESYKIKFVEDHKVHWEDVQALKNVDLRIRRGESVCIMGPNGSGKSTLLKLIAGILSPDKGRVSVNGEVSALLDLGAGFHPELTGKENVYINAALYGLSKKEIDLKFDKVVEFSGIGKFINAPVKNYSQGMFVRLAFSVAIHVEPEILLIDDTLAVGDETFQRQCMERIFELKLQGKTIVFVSHDMSLASKLCERGVFLKDGRVVKDSSIERVISLYLESCGGDSIFSSSREKKKADGSIVHGGFKLSIDTGRARLFWKDTELTDDMGMRTSFVYLGKVYTSAQGEWQILNREEKKLAVRVEWKDVPVAQLWRIEFEADGALCWDVRMDVYKEVNIHERRIGVSLSGRYKRWFTECEQGLLTGAEGDGEYMVNLKNCACRKAGFGATNDGASILPGVELNRASDNSDRIFTIQRNSSGGSSGVTIQLLEIGSLHYLPGRYVYFKGTLKSVIENLQTQKRSPVSTKKWRERGRCEIESGDLLLRFDNGIGRLFWKDEELTTGLGAYTSVHSSGTWYDSGQAIWTIEETDEKGLIAKGVWPLAVPIFQTWQIQTMNERLIIWKIETGVYKNVQFDREQVSMMLTDKYKYWQASDQGSGKFPDGFNDNFGLFWDRMWSGSVKAGLISASTSIHGQGSQPLPGVGLDCAGQGPSWRAIIENSNSFYKGRILQCQRINCNEHISPCQYECFDGKIRIE